ncbi:MAG: carboxymuconolactone decarboxylase family protein [Desulfocucumaceae bacterium]
MPRIPVLPLEQMPEKTREMMTGGKSDLKGLNINKTMAHAENSVRHFMRMGNSLLTQAKLDARLRELAILRIATLCRSRYEWYQHEKLARKIGVPEEQIEAVKQGTGSPAFNGLEQAVLRYTDEVTLNVKSSDRAFEELAAALSQRELVELTLTIGFYNMVARFLENTGVEIEGGGQAG